MSKNLADVIIEEFERFDLNQLYSWNIPERDGIKCEGKSSFEKNVSLKNKICERMHNELDEEYLKDAYWIIKKWGGIRNFKENSNDHKQNLLDLKNKIDAKADIEVVFEGKYDIIASYSKVAAFYQPDKYAVFDARVAFTLRWLIYDNNLATKYFRQLPSRNKKINDCIEKLKNKIPSYKYPKNEEYAEYCKLLKSVAEKMGKKIYEVEMFLFSIAAPKRNEKKEGVKYITDRV